VSGGTLIALQSVVLALVVILSCVAACAAIGRILFVLYGPRRRVRVPSGSRVIIQPAFKPYKAPPSPRSRLARGTGSAVVNTVIDAEATDKVAPIEYR
jgi:hypothetical protein